MLFTLLMSFNYQGPISYEHQALAEDCWTVGRAHFQAWLKGFYQAFWV